MSASYLTFDLPVGGTSSGHTTSRGHTSANIANRTGGDGPRTPRPTSSRHDTPVLRPRTSFVDPVKSVHHPSTPTQLHQSPAASSHAYVPTTPLTPSSPRLARTLTPRRVSSPALSGSSPRMPRFVSVAEQSMASSSAASYRSTATAASQFSLASGAPSSTSHGPGHSSTPVRLATPLRAPATPVRTSTATSTPSNLRGTTRPSSPAVNVRPRAHSPVIATPVSRTLSRPSTPLSRTSSAVPSLSGTFSGSPSTPTGIAATPRQLLRELANSWKNRGSESSTAFGEGGYMTVNPGDVLQGRYETITKLGWGEFSTVWLAIDRKASGIHRTFVAVKIAKCRADVMRSTKYECYLLAYVRKRVSRSAPVAMLLDCFEARGKFGGHLCMAMPLLGSNMLCVIEQFKSRGKKRRSERELATVKEITVGVLRALGYLANANILHTDLKPENVLVSAPDGKVVRHMQSYCRQQGLQASQALKEIEEGDATKPIATLADFGLGLLLEPGNTTDAAAQAVVQRKQLNVPKPGVLRNDRGMLIQTREYRAPEVLFGTDFNCRTDVWSLGCMTYELITGDFLMDPKRRVRGEQEMDVEHVAMMMQILGPVPARLTSPPATPAAGAAPSGPAPGTPRPTPAADCHPTTGKYMSRFFDAKGQFLHSAKYAKYPRRSIAAELETFLDPSEAERAAQFIMSCFTYDPSERCHATDLLKHSWLRGVQGAKEL